MKFREIASHLTGLSSPVFGISWSPPEAEVTTAKRVLAFLEDRRVLYQPSEMEVPEQCIGSVNEIRHCLTAELGKLDQGSQLTQNLRALRAACRKFLDQVQEAPDGTSSRFGPVWARGAYGTWLFYSALGELRGAFGIHVAQIAVRNGLDVEDQLAAIFPAEDFAALPGTERHA